MVFVICLHPHTASDESLGLWGRVMWSDAEYSNFRYETISAWKTHKLLVIANSRENMWRKSFCCCHLIDIYLFSCCSLACRNWMWTIGRPIRCTENTLAHRSKWFGSGRCALFQIGFLFFLPISSYTIIDAFSRIVFMKLRKCLGRLSGAISHLLISELMQCLKSICNSCFYSSSCRRWNNLSAIAYSRFNDEHFILLFNQYGCVR